jgi:hypothetical protein
MDRLRVIALMKNQLLIKMMYGREVGRGAPANILAQIQGVIFGKPSSLQALIEVELTLIV